jgi:16S rRNA (guanine966-N2)-methyltransferase
VRETLFNWLGGRVPGARCLDLFAGSGALGLEALSRGAAQVTFVDQDPAAVDELAARLVEWRATGGRVERADALRFLTGEPQPFDIVFLDPPFGSDLLEAAARLLEERRWLAPGAVVYVESAARTALPAFPDGWTLIKAKQAGEVGYHLLVRAAVE